jgi:hypothetical protein
VTAARPETSIQQFPTTENPALEQALSILKQHENDFRHCDAKLREFRKASMVVINGTSRFLGASLESGKQLRDEYFELLRQRDAAKRDFMTAMERFSEVKTGKTFRVGVDDGS